METLLSNRPLLFAARWVLGLVFLVAAIPKIAQPELFAASIEAYEILPVAPVNAAAILLPWLELFCAVFLLGGVRVRPSAAILGSMLLVFIAAISIAVLRGLDINCGCFGATGGSTVGWGKVLEDVALLVPVWLLRRKGAGESDGGPGETGRAGPHGESTAAVR